MSKDSHDKRSENIDNFRAWTISRRDLIKITGMGLTALAGTNLPGISTCTQAFAISEKNGVTSPGSPAGIPKPDKPHMEQRIPSAVRGTVTHGAFLPYQMGALRPIPKLGHYRTPVDNVYLCASGSHPGGGVTMAPGCNAARVIQADLSKK